MLRAQHVKRAKIQIFSTCLREIWGGEILQLVGWQSRLPVFVAGQDHQVHRTWGAISTAKHAVQQDQTVEVLLLHIHSYSVWVQHLLEQAALDVSARALEDLIIEEGTGPVFSSKGDHVWGWIPLTQLRDQRLQMSNVTRWCWSSECENFCCRQCTKT